MHITVGGIVTLAVVAFIWIFAAAVANDPGCNAIEKSTVMAEPAKVLMRLFLLCWLD